MPLRCVFHHIFFQVSHRFDPFYDLSLSITPPAVPQPPVQKSAVAAVKDKSKGKVLDSENGASVGFDALPPVDD